MLSHDSQTGEGGKEKSAALELLPSQMGSQQEVIDFSSRYLPFSLARTAFHVRLSSFFRHLVSSDVVYCSFASFRGRIHTHQYMVKPPHAQDTLSSMKSRDNSRPDMVSPGSGFVYSILVYTFPFPSHPPFFFPLLSNTPSKTRRNRRTPNAQA
ncbi:uncharacterized protein EI97DRAFT_145713 [Westerdykella ornata]|uniref:Uncharacterized protein n=1 Tax=Westerdykella ornata TaxID=318751 RepID=A0A6A6JDV3_WESOR|nr:uncharacterized protein EI97DRAFT_145713 [Westerdykella ornata]KAF2273826.1 hypothetical protein EI97DRAFT_145713 [Westerdykella ornata]